MMVPSKLYVILPVAISIMIGMVGSFTPSPIANTNTKPPLGLDDSGRHLQQQPLMMSSKEEDPEKIAKEFFKKGNKEELVGIIAKNVTDMLVHERLGDNDSQGDDNNDQGDNEDVGDAACVAICAPLPQGSGMRMACCTNRCKNSAEYALCLAE